MPDLTPPPTLEYGVDSFPGGFNRGCLKRTLFILGIVVLFFVAMIVFGKYYTEWSGSKKPTSAPSTAPAGGGIQTGPTSRGATYGI